MTRGGGRSLWLMPSRSDTLSFLSEYLQSDRGLINIGAQQYWHTPDAQQLRALWGCVQLRPHTQIGCT
eukprot:scaffold35212_cov69-Phaeocystis_antarctica.AAC.5